jgi:hypothetical protein
VVEGGPAYNPDLLARLGDGRHPGGSPQPDSRRDGQGPGRGGDHTGTPATTWPAEHDVAAAEVGAPDVVYESLVSPGCCRQGCVCWA